MTDPFPSKESHLKELDSRLQAQFEKATVALSEGNIGYTKELASNWILKYPNVPEFRMLLREAQICEKYPRKKFQQAPKGTISGLLSWLNFDSKNPNRAIQQCEEKLRNDPLDIKANEMLANAAGNLGWGRTEIFALQTLLLHPQRKPQHVIRLIEVLVAKKELDNASKTCQVFLKVFPNHRDLLAIRNRVSISQSMEKVDS